MKKNGIAALVLLLTAAAAFTPFEDTLSVLGIDKPYAKDVLFKNLTEEGETRIPYMPGLPKIIAGDKVGAAKDVFSYMKAYYESPEFAKQYAELREREKPTYEPPPMFDAETLKEMKESLAYNEKEAANTKNPASVRAASKQQADQIRQIIEGADDPTPNKTKWEKKYPADPAKLIAAKLQSYIDLAGKVDYSAQLAAPDRYGKKKFINPEYEKKSTTWKAVYRAGKEVNTAVSAMASDWIRQGIRIAKPGTASVHGSAAGTEAGAANPSDDAGTKKAEDNKNKVPTLRSLKDKYLPKKN